MARQEAQPPEAGDGIHRGEELGQPGMMLLVVIRVDVLAEQRDLSHPLRHQALDMLDDLGQRPAQLPPSNERHDAVGAHLVAATHDRNVRAQAV